MNFWLKLALGAAALGAGAIVIRTVINKKKIKEEAKRRCPDALYALIQEKKKNAVNVGIFDEEEDKIDQFDLESESGVDYDLYEGQKIYI